MSIKNSFKNAYAKHLKIPLTAGAVAISSLVTSFDLNAEGSANTGSAYNKGTQISKTSANQNRDLSEYLPENYVKSKYTLKLEEAQKWAEQGKGVAVNLIIGVDIGDATDEDVKNHIAKTLDRWPNIPLEFFIEHKPGGYTILDFAAEKQTYAGYDLTNYKDALLDAAITYASAEKLRRKVLESDKLTMN